LKTSNIGLIIIDQLNHLIECIRTFLKLQDIELGYIPTHDTNVIGLSFMIEGRRKSKGNDIVYVLVRKSSSYNKNKYPCRFNEQPKNKKNHEYC